MKVYSKFMLLCMLSVIITVNADSQQLGHPVAITQNNGASAIVSMAPDSRAWTDPALNHNKLLQQQQGDGGYRLVGAYKVMGSPFLFGEHHKADMFATEAKAYNIYISYNTYNQEVEFYSTSNPDKPLVKETGTVDSFIIQQNVSIGITSSLKFVYGSVLGVKEKYYFQEVYKGSNYSLYKRYKSDLGYVSSNYIQADLRQFDLLYDYFYSDTTKPGLKKLKTNFSSITKEFKDKKDISPVFTDEEFTANQEAALRKAFEYLNL
ncbi:MAG: hypothetical protein HOP10_09695 [Chitinophagaceae bacterium]|nr:hypothetical protein [Chitinophagaceae bacterium]